MNSEQVWKGIGATMVWCSEHKKVVTIAGCIVVGIVIGLVLAR
jgi:hypothetical protein